MQIGRGCNKATVHPHDWPLISISPMRSITRDHKPDAAGAAGCVRYTGGAAAVELVDYAREVGVAAGAGAAHD